MIDLTPQQAAILADSGACIPMLRWYANQLENYKNGNPIHSTPSDTTDARRIRHFRKTLRDAAICDFFPTSNPGEYRMVFPTEILAADLHRSLTHRFHIPTTITLDLLTHILDRYASIHDDPIAVTEYAIVSAQAQQIPPEKFPQYLLRAMQNPQRTQQHQHADNNGIPPNYDWNEHARALNRAIGH